MSLPILRRGDRMSITSDGAVYELENGDVLLIALYYETDSMVSGREQARLDAVARARLLLPATHGDPQPDGDWIDLLSSGFYGNARKFIAKRLDALEKRDK